MWERVNIVILHSCLFSGCNRTYTDSQGQIYSPGWPGVYPHNANCQILIQGPADSTVSMYFNVFHIEPHSNCQFDNLAVRIHSFPDAMRPQMPLLCTQILCDGFI